MAMFGPSSGRGCVFRFWEERRGFTLLETVVALFILAGSAMVCAGLIESALRATGAAKDQMIAVMLGEGTLRQVEIQARDLKWWQAKAPDVTDTVDGASTDWSKLASPWMVSGPGPDGTDNPRFRVFVQVWNNVIHSPSRGAPDEYPMKNSERLVEVTVSWRSHTAGLQLLRAPSITLVGTLREPDRTAGGVAVTASSTGPLDPYKAPATGVSTITATASDTLGTIPDLRFHFYVNPGDGDGTIEATANDTTTLYNYVILPLYPGPKCAAMDGSCKVQARCVSGGREAWGESPEIELKGGSVPAPATTPWPFDSPAGGS